MKSVFPDFYKYSEEEFKGIFNDCYFILDTNVLLNLYRYSETTKNEWIGILEKIKEQLWMPYQVGLEFHFSRITVILEQQQAYDNICKRIKEQASTSITNIKKGLNIKRNRHPKIHINSIEERIEDCFNSLIKDLKKHEEEHPDLLNEDGILKFLNQVFENKVGQPYQQVKLEEIYSDGEVRYQKKFPPGYEDEKTKKDQTKEYDGKIYKDKFGDLVVWNQILDKAKSEAKPIIFVTDDRKEDWWELEGGKNLGPRTELLNEFRKAADVPFYMYNPENFMSYIKEHLKEQVSEEAIKEMEDLRETYTYTQSTVPDIASDMLEDGSTKLKYIFNSDNKKDQDSLNYIEALLNNIHQKLKSLRATYKPKDRVLYDYFYEDVYVNLVDKKKLVMEGDEDLGEYIFQLETFNDSVRDELDSRVLQDFYKK